MAGNGRFRVALELTFGACLAGLGPAGRFGRLVGGRAGHLGVWYEHLARRELPFPSLADLGYLAAIPLAAAACWPSRAGPNGPPSRCGRCWTGR